MSNGSGSLTDQVLTQSQSSREVIQEFCALADSLEWDLGQQYLRQRGNKAFISDSSAVPYVINNDGTLSRHAAEVFFASLLEADKAGTLSREIHVLELGIGVGLFARYFLDHMQDLSRQHKKDYYQRLIYTAADRSERMLTDVLRHGVLANHPGRYRMRQIDAMQPEVLLRDVEFLRAEQPQPPPLFIGGMREELPPAESGPVYLGGMREKLKPFRAVFLNYLLDCLPAAVLRFDGDKVQQLHVRTVVARNVRLKDYTDLTAEQLRRRAAAGTPQAKRDLLEVYGLFASEYDYRPVDIKTLPYADFAAGQAKRSSRLVHSHGAIHCLEQLLNLVADDCFILANDYGQTISTKDDDFEHQRFSLATFVGVNFPQLDRYFDDERRCKVVKPTGDSRGIHSRLFMKKPSVEVIERFYDCFNDANHERLQEPINQARGLTKSGRYEMADWYYKEALRRQPHNWVLLNEYSMFQTFSMRDPKHAANIAKVALALNPSLSAELWSTLGDALYEWGRTTEARGAYEKALAVNAADVRARFNLAFVHVRERNFDAAIKRLGEAFCLDKTGEWRERLLAKFQQVLESINGKHAQEYLLMINLVSHFTKAKDETPQPGDKRD
jgi:tetratricopeptide (TPR) repeat protein